MRWLETEGKRNSPKRLGAWQQESRRMVSTRKVSDHLYFWRYAVAPDADRVWALFRRPSDQL